jgi:hypothetical protein
VNVVVAGHDADLRWGDPRRRREGAGEPRRRLGVLVGGAEVGDVAGHHDEVDLADLGPQPRHVRREATEHRARVPGRLRREVQVGEVEHADGAPGGGLCRLGLCGRLGARPGLGPLRRGARRGRGVRSLRQLHGHGVDLWAPLLTKLAEQVEQRGLPLLKLHALGELVEPGVGVGALVGRELLHEARSPLAALEGVGQLAVAVGEEAVQEGDEGWGDHGH